MLRRTCRSARTARHHTACLYSSTNTCLAGGRISTTPSTPPLRRSSTSRAAGLQVPPRARRRNPRCFRTRDRSTSGGLSGLQSTDAAKAYHCGILLLVKLLGQPVPGVPTNTREAREVLSFVDDLLRTMWRHRDWFVRALVLAALGRPIAPMQVGAISPRAAVLPHDVRRRGAASRVAQRSRSRRVPSPRRAQERPRRPPADAGPAACPGAPRVCLAAVASA